MSWVEEVLRRYNLENEFNNQRPLMLWPSVVGPQIARIAQPLQFVNGVLTVAVSSATVQQELFLLQSQYIARLNQAIGADKVRAIRFVPGRMPQLHRVSKPPHDSHLSADAMHMFADVSDPGLRRAFTRLYSTLRQREAALVAAGGKRCVRCGVVFFGAGEVCPGCRFDADTTFGPHDAPD